MTGIKPFAAKTNETTSLKSDLIAVTSQMPAKSSNLILTTDSSVNRNASKSLRGPNYGNSEPSKPRDRSC